jgi:hypothetical protein
LKQETPAGHTHAENLMGYLYGNKLDGKGVVVHVSTRVRRIRITASDQPAGHPYAGKLIAYLYGNKLVSDWSDLVGDTHALQFLAKITAISPNASIILDRPLPYDLDINWLNVGVHAWSPASTVSKTASVEFISVESPLHIVSPMLWAVAQQPDLYAALSL